MSVAHTVSELGRLDVPEDVVRHASSRMSETFDVHDSEDIYQAVSSQTHQPRWAGRPAPLRNSVSGEAPVYFGNVFSYIADGPNDGAKASGLQAVLNHPAGRHWGLHVEDPPSGLTYLYHLVFEAREDAVIDSHPDSLTGKIKEIKLEVRRVTRPMADIEKVGTTRYTTGEVTGIGTRLVNHFLTLRRPLNPSLRHISSAFLELPNLRQDPAEVGLRARIQGLRCMDIIQRWKHGMSPVCPF